MKIAIGTHPCPDVAGPRRTIAPKVREDNLDGMLMTIGVLPNKEKTSLIQCYLNITNIIYYVNLSVYTKVSIYTYVCCLYT